MTYVLLTDSDRFPFAPSELTVLADAGARVDLLLGHDLDEIATAASSAVAVFVYSGQFDQTLMARLGQCRILARCGVGYDNIDVAAARETGHCSHLCARLRRGRRRTGPPRASVPLVPRQTMHL
jgi:phosphoglycerate dehydrogenase-like enzyme